MKTPLLAGYEIEVRGADRPSKSIGSKSASFDLILSDLRMSDRCALEVLAQARIDAPGVPFVLYSAAIHATGASLSE